MTFEQVFDKYKVIIDIDDFTIWVTDSAFNMCYLDIFNQEVTYYRNLPSHDKDAFEIINVFQEALALSRTKNLTVDLLVEVGYTEFK